MRQTRSTRRIRASRQSVYRALLDPTAVAAWRSPDDMTVTVHRWEPDVGGEFRVSLTYDHATDTGKTAARTDTYHGHFAALTPDRRVVEVVEFETADPGLQGPMTITTTLTDLTAAGGDPVTEIATLFEDLPPAVAPADNELGTAMSLDKLAALIEGPGGGTG